MATYVRNNYVSYGEDPASSTKYNAEIDNIYLGLNDLDDKKLARDGSQALTGDIDAGGYTITNAKSPSLDTDMAIKSYVDAIAYFME